MTLVRQILTVIGSILLVVASFPPDENSDRKARIGLTERILAVAALFFSTMALTMWILS